jgi:hypothetical protein
MPTPDAFKCVNRLKLNPLTHIQGEEIVAITQIKVIQSQAI